VSIKHLLISNSAIVEELMMDDLIMKTHDSKEALKELDRIRNTGGSVRKDLNTSALTSKRGVFSPIISNRANSKESVVNLS